MVLLIGAFTRDTVSLLSQTAITNDHMSFAEMCGIPYSLPLPSFPPLWGSVVYLSTHPLLPTNGILRAIFPSWCGCWYCDTSHQSTSD